MKRTTVFMDEQVQRELQALARRRQRPMASLVREAVEQYVATARGDAGRPALGFVAIGRSGRRDIAERHEELLFEDGPGGGRPGAGRRGARRPPADRAGAAPAPGTRKSRRGGA